MDQDSWFLEKELTCLMPGGISVSLCQLDKGRAKEGLGFLQETYADLPWWLSPPQGMVLYGRRMSPDPVTSLSNSSSLGLALPSRAFLFCW